MLKRGILNSHLNAELSRLGHTQLVVVADCGLPIPRGVPTVDLAVVLGVPTFEQVLDAVLDAIVVEGSVAATESADGRVAQILGQRGLTPELVSHEHLKALLPDAALVVRTGSDVPYANVMLRCGVPF